MRSSTFGLLLLAAVTGCAIGPSTRVDSPAPAAVRAADTLADPAARAFVDSLAVVREREAGDSAPAAIWRPRPLTLDASRDLPWIEVLRDPALASLVETAVGNNRDLQAAAARVREYRALAGVARADLFPQITANASASHTQTIFGTFPPQTFDAVQITGDLAWELDFWGRLRRQAQAGGFEYRGRQEDERAAVLSLVSSVALAYLELRELDENLAIAERTLESRRASLALARQRFEGGVISELDVRQFEAEAAAPAARVAEFARARAQKEHQLSQLIGQAPGPIARGQPLAASVQAVAVPDSIPADLLLRRPDVRAAERDLQAARARVGLALGSRLPRIAITGSYGTRRPDFDQLFSSNSEIYSVQVGVSVPLFTGFNLENQERAARARADQARARYEQAVLTALREADDALVGLKLGRDQLAAQQTQVQALARGFALAERRYQTGVSSYLEVLDAQRALFNAQLALVQVERLYLGQTVQLYRALGGAWTGKGER
ncbi:MAG: efflux transporter outer membrane subunit [Gemmatimonadales bacterium]